MNAWDDRLALTDHDQSTLATIEEALDDPQPGTTAPTSMPEFCRYLAATVPGPRPGVEADLERRLEAVHGRRQNRRSLLRFVPARPQGRIAGAILVVTASLSALSAVPAVRGWAQADVSQLMSQLGLQNGPVSLEKSAGAGEINNLNRQQAAQQLGFTPAIPDYLPSGYPTPASFIVYLTHPKSVWWRVTKDNGPWYGEDRITLVEDPIADTTSELGKPLAVGNAANPTRVTVAGVQGLWLQLPDQINVDISGHRTISRYHNVLRWNRDRIRYTLFVPLSTSLSEALRIADSLQ